MITDRNKFSFVTICIGLCFLLTSASFASAQATSSTQQESNEQQQQQQTQKQAAIATISVVDNKDNKEEETNAIINEQANEVVHSFSPRLDYSNEWRPVGRGDPLKNDPTFDYSPPTLEHVRYWAETTKDGNSKEELGGSKQDSNNINYARPNKPQQNLLVSKPNEHLRGASTAYQTHHHPHPNQYAMPHPAHPLKNAKGETPLLQPKYQSVRRSYYAQQLPTRLMPPPMQMNSPPINTFNVPMKPSPVSQANVEYRHSMPGPAAAPGSASMGSQSPSVAHMKTQHYTGMSTPSSMLWSYNSPSAMQHHPQQQQQKYHPYMMSSSSGAPISKATTQETARTPSVYDSYSQDSHHYVSYMRPNVNSMSSHAPQETYSPNSLHHSGVGSMKQSGGGRKPWLQELLRKEVVKTSVRPSYASSSDKFVYETTKPTYATTKHSYGTTKPSYGTTVHTYKTTKPIYERMPSTSSISSGFTPYTPVTHVPAPPTIATITSTTTMRVPLNSASTYHPIMSTTLGPFTASTAGNVFYSTPPTTTTTTTTPRTTTTTTSSRLLIPTTSNLASRPTVTPMQMTTDSLFSHYKQPESPFRGPMYLIIEGHSKVKKYGKNGINLNLPKIVPVVPKREPIVRVADPGEQKRGTPETFQVEHLHVKSSTPAPRTTTTSTARVSTTEKPRTTTTTSKPITSSEKPPTSPKPSTSPRPSTGTKPSGKLVVSKKIDTTTRSTLKAPVPTTTTTTSRPAATVGTLKPNSTSATTKDEQKTLKKATETAKPLTTTPKPTYDDAPLLKLELPNEPPTGMQGLLSLLDSSLGSLFAEQPLDMAEQTSATAATTHNLATPSTILQALTNSSTPLHSSTPSQTILMPVAANARLGTNAQRILAVADSAADGSAEFSYTTDMPPREVRQVFDYDQRPESRLKDFAIKSVVDDGVAAASEEAASSAFYEDEFEAYDDDDDEDGNRQQIKRIDHLIYGDEGEFVGDYEDVKLEEFGMNMGDVRMQAKMA